MQTLKKIEIKGFKSIENASIELGNLNVVIGANGSGKSNLIGAFKLLERKFSDRLKLHVADQPERFFHLSPKVTPEMSLKLFFDGQTYGIRLKPALDSLLIVDESDQGCIKDMATKWVAYHFNDTSDLSPAKHIADLDDNRWLRHDAANLPAFLYWLQEKEPVSFRMLEEHVRLVAPFFERFVLAPHHLNENKIKLKWQHKGSDAHFDAYSLSDGTLRFICLAALLLQAEPPSLVLLDEPELGLHPYAIRVLAELLDAAAIRSQVIVATQSVTLLNNFGPNDVIVAEHNGTKTDFKRLLESELDTWLEDYSIGELWEMNVLGGRP